MTEKDWGDLESLPAQRSGAPKWLWFCGCGCLVMLFAVVAAGWGSFSWFRSGIQGDERWERLAEVLPYDERPVGYGMAFAQNVPFMDVEVFLFTVDGALGEGAGDGPSEEDGGSRTEGDSDPGDAKVDADVDDPDSPDEDEADGETAPRRRGGGEDPPFFLITAMGEEMSREALPDLSRTDREHTTTITVQGRELLAMRLEDEPPPGLRGLPRHQQPTLMVHLTPEGGTRGVFLLAGREASNAPIDVDEVVKFLDGFHVGPDR